LKGSFQLLAISFQILPWLRATASWQPRAKS